MWYYRTCNGHSTITTQRSCRLKIEFLICIDSASWRRRIETGSEELVCHTAQDTGANIAGGSRYDGHTFPQASAWCTRAGG